jgi:hypothetical protein
MRPLPLVRALVLAFVALCCFVAFPSPSRAQDDGANPNNDLGLKPYDSLHGGDIDNVVMSSGGLSVHIPVYSAPQRGGKLKFSFSLEYHSKLLVISNICVDNHGHPACSRGWKLNPAGYGFQLVMDGLVFPVCGVATSTLNPYAFYECSANTSDGGSHPMGEVATTGTWETLDATGIRVNWSPSAGLNPVAIDQDGISYQVTSPAISETVADTNGNTITVTDFAKGAYATFPLNANASDSLYSQLPITADALVLCPSVALVNLQRPALTAALIQ